ncbi:hypothetical protein BOTBODRAFT_146571 [Botryobasidium botryosum FD-172 SS1]|uniref:Uncharacterized protein n=1 Tax=Botryobasidium botryosum (strain FD-172 SS1) TaxID=930990 RepID=A0A067MLT8_BOTB1|nr:hypothetical protein BOTBODRAFT_146571 [Botryobasidium botryosum FD-172 SS1]
MRDTAILLVPYEMTQESKTSAPDSGIYHESRREVGVCSTIQHPPFRLRESLGVGNKALHMAKTFVSMSGEVTSRKSGGCRASLSTLSTHAADLWGIQAKGVLGFYTGGNFGDLPSATERLAVSDSIPFVVTKALSKVYYKGLPSGPPLIATTKPRPLEYPTGPEAYLALKELRELGDHPLAISRRSASSKSGSPPAWPSSGLASDRLWAEGTGGFYLSAGEDDKGFYLIIVRHAVLPLDEDDNKEYGRRNDNEACEDVIVFGTSGFNEKLAAIDCEIRGQESAITDAEERIESVTEREEAEQDLQKVEKGLKALKALRREIVTHWGAREKCVFGEPVWAPPAIFSTEPGQYTLDLAVSKLDLGKFGAKNYCGNSINVGNKYMRQEFMDKVYLHHKLPASRLVTLQDQVLESVLARPPVLDINSDPCLVVFKNGAKTGTTISKANNVSSYTRNYFAGQ